MKNIHNRDCQFGDNWQECPACLENLGLSDTNPTPSPAPVAPGLLPCPFCAKADFIYPRRVGFPVSAKCVHCNAEGPLALTAPEAIAAWNTRAPAPAPASGWMERLNEYVCKNFEMIARQKSQHFCADEPIRETLLRIIARHAPDVAKLEAELEGTSEMFLAMKKTAEDTHDKAAKLEAEVAELKADLAATADALSLEAVKWKKTAKTQDEEHAKTLAEKAALEAENARLREAMNDIPWRLKDADARGCVETCQIIEDALKI